MGCSQPGSFVQGILQASILEWVAIPPTRGSSQPRDRTQVFCMQTESTAEPPEKPKSESESLNCVQLFVTPRTAAHQAPLSFTTSCCLLKSISTELVMLSNYLILCCSLLLLPGEFYGQRSLVGCNPWGHKESDMI